MEFPILRPSEIHRSAGQRFNTPHIIRSPFSKSQQQQSAAASQPRNLSFTSFSGYAEDEEILPFDDFADPSEPPELPTSYWGGHSASRTRAAASNYRGSSRTGMIDWAYMQRPSSAVLWTSAGTRPGLTQLGLSFDEEARNNYLESIRTFGFDYMKPPGITKTMQMAMEEEDVSDEYVEEEGFLSEEEVDSMSGENEDAAEDGSEAGSPSANLAAIFRDYPVQQLHPHDPEQAEINLDDMIASGSDFGYSDEDEENEEERAEDGEEQDFEDDPFMVEEEYDRAVSGDDEDDVDALMLAVGASEYSDDDGGSANDTFGERHNGGRHESTDAPGSTQRRAASLGLEQTGRSRRSSAWGTATAVTTTPHRESLSLPLPPRPRSSSIGIGSSRGAEARLSGRIVSSEYGGEFGLDAHDAQHEHVGELHTPVRTGGRRSTIVFDSEGESEMEVDDD